MPDLDDPHHPVRAFAKGTPVVFFDDDCPTFLAGRTSGDPWQGQDGIWRVEVRPEQGLRHVVRCHGLYALTPDRLAAVLWAGAESLGADGWHPIETAPRDGETMVDLWIEGPEVSRIETRCVWATRDPDYPEMVGPHWRTEGFGFVCDDFDEETYEGPSGPTHWRPSPARPRDLPPRETADG